MGFAQILTIEDDAAIRQAIVDALEFASYSVIQAAGGDDGLDLALHASYDLLLLDLVLPHVSGLEILRQLRAARASQPVIVLTAKGDENDRVEGLKLGADDYVVKPFSVKELIARVEAVLRRSPARPSDVRQIRLPAGTADLDRHEIRSNNGVRVDLSDREVELLSSLARHTGRAISREEILSHVWQLNPQGVSTRTIDMHIARLREKLRSSAPHTEVVLTVRGKGYMFRWESDQSPPNGD